MTALGVEHRIVDLENENKARKAVYPVAGSLVPFVSATSRVWSVVGRDSIPVTVRVRFTPSKAISQGVSITDLFPQVSTSSDFGVLYPRMAFRNEPQSGDGSVVIELRILSSFTPTTYYFRILTTGVADGTFTLL